MHDPEPFLFRFKKECVSPWRATGDVGYEYDADLQMLMVKENGKRIPAIESTKNQPPKTKKADIEKGEDQKDSRGWW